jgi:hypothetical protein
VAASVRDRTEHSGRVAAARTQPGRVGRAAQPAVSAATTRRDPPGGAAAAGPGSAARPRSPGWGRRARQAPSAIRRLVIGARAAGSGEVGGIPRDCAHLPQIHRAGRPARHPAPGYSWPRRTGARCPSFDGRAPPALSAEHDPRSKGRLRPSEFTIGPAEGLSRFDLPINSRAEGARAPDWTRCGARSESRLDRLQLIPCGTPRY